MIVIIAASRKTVCGSKLAKQENIYTYMTENLHLFIYIYIFMKIDYIPA